MVVQGSPFSLKPELNLFNIRLLETFLGFLQHIIVSVYHITVCEAYTERFVLNISLEFVYSTPASIVSMNLIFISCDGGLRTETRNEVIENKFFQIQCIHFLIISVLIHYIYI